MNNCINSGIKNLLDCISLSVAEIADQLISNHHTISSATSNLNRHHSSKLPQKRIYQEEMTQSYIDILKNMKFEELWELFLITLMPHNPEWMVWAKDEIQSLSELLTAFTPIINHIGSTAIPVIMAKPIVDILVEISPDCDWNLGPIS
ncbi:MAG: GrpB family protein [Muribaculum sp.]|nr:GrpB family protein [Muribaculaceae bacterium]MCM1080516.1 GrpB family protein [Muribaculum sp.]